MAFRTSKRLVSIPPARRRCHEDRDELVFSGTVPGGVRVLCQSAGRRDQGGSAVRRRYAGHARRARTEELAHALLARNRRPGDHGSRHGQGRGAEHRQAEERFRRDAHFDDPDKAKAVGRCAAAESRLRAGNPVPAIPSGQVRCSSHSSASLRIAPARPAGAGDCPRTSHVAGRGGCRKTDQRMTEKPANQAANAARGPYSQRERSAAYASTAAARSRASASIHSAFTGPTTVNQIRMDSPSNAVPRRLARNAGVPRSSIASSAPIVTAKIWITAPTAPYIEYIVDVTVMYNSGSYRSRGGISSTWAPPGISTSAAVMIAP